VIYRFIDEHMDQWPVRLLCDALEVSPASYYAWRGRPASVRRQEQDALLVEIRAIHAEFKARYGSPRVHAELAARGHDCCVNTVAKLMRQNDIRAKTARKFRCTTDSNHDLPVAENLLDRQFDPEATNEAWVAEIVYSQMTKPAGLAGRPDREHIADLDGVSRYYHSVDEQFDQLSLPFKRRRVESHCHTPGEVRGGRHQPGHLRRPARLAGQLLLLP
jgi:hypothetical protein